MSVNVTSNDPTGLKLPSFGISAYGPHDSKSEGWCTTKTAEDVHFKFDWKIENFRRVLEKAGTGKSNYLYSSLFCISSRPDGNLGQDDVLTRWRLLLYPNGPSAEDVGNLGIYICNQNDQEIRCVYRCKLSILDSNKKPVLIWCPDKPIVFPSRTSPGNARGTNRFITHKKLLQEGTTSSGAAAAELLPQNKLTPCGCIGPTRWHKNFGFFSFS